MHTYLTLFTLYGKGKESGQQVHVKWDKKNPLTMYAVHKAVDQLS